MRKVQSGIYLIINNVNNHLYIGSSKWVGHRCDTHFNHLRKNKHHCTYLQNAWNLYGEKSFVFYLLEETGLAKEELITKEQIYLDEAKKEGWITYNISTKAGSRLGTKWSSSTRDKAMLYFRSPEFRNKMRLVHLGRKIRPEDSIKHGLAWRGKKRPKFSEQWKRNISISKMNISDETRLKMSRAKQGRKLTDEHKKHISLGNIGRIVSLETRQKISLAHRQ